MPNNAFHSDGPRFARPAGERGRWAYMSLRHILFAAGMLLVTSCHFWGFDTMVLEFHRTGGIGYGPAPKPGYFFVELWEHKNTPTDTHQYETILPEQRARAAEVLLMQEEKCSSVTTLSEEPFLYEGPPTWSHGKWWRLYVQCLHK